MALNMNKTYEMSVRGKTLTTPVPSCIPSIEWKPGSSTVDGTDTLKKC